MINDFLGRHLFPGEWGPAPSRLCLGISLWHSQPEALLLEDGDNRKEDQKPRWSCASQPEGTPVSSGPVQSCARKATHSLVLLSLLRCSERPQPRQRRAAGPGPQGLVCEVVLTASLLSLRSQCGF